MKDLTGKYLGPNKIKGVSPAERRTHRGDEISIISFEDGTSQELPLKLLEIGVTETASDFSTLRDKTTVPCVEQIIEVLLNSELRIEDFDYVLSRVKGSIQESIGQAMDKLWGKDSFLLTLRDIDNTIKHGKTKDSIKTGKGKSPR